MSRLVCGLDIGQARDPTAFSVLEASDDYRHIDIRHLEQFPLDLPYPEYVRLTAERVRSPQLRGCTLVIDHTGVGRPVYDMFVAARLFPVGITITGGERASRKGRLYRVPKRDLAAAILMLMQSKRMLIARAIPHAPVLIQELLNFRVKVTPSGQDTYEAWREGDHDDLVLSVACASWYLLNGPTARLLAAVGGSIPTFDAPQPSAGPSGPTRPLSHVLRGPAVPALGRFSPLGQRLRDPNTAERLLR